MGDIYRKHTLSEKLVHSMNSSLKRIIIAEFGLTKYYDILISRIIDCSSILLIFGIKLCFQ